MSDDLDFIIRKAKYQNMTPREYCISKIMEYRTYLQKVSKDYRELSEEEFDKLLDEEIRERNNNE